MPMKVRVQRLGTVDYTEAWEFQKRLHVQVVSGESMSTLLLLEHPHVYTLGRRGKAEDVLVSPEKLIELGAEVHYIDRGGEATYHGPGQLVGYPIINLSEWKGGARKYVRALEDTLIATLAEFDIEAESEGRPTGVWVGDAKIAAIGVRISRKTTMHGFALNVDPDLLYFDHIVSCGLPGSRVTSMSHELDRPISASDVMSVLTRMFGEVFGVEVQEASD